MVDGSESTAAGDVGGDPLSIVEASRENILRAAELLRGGTLVGMPTETVYGLAANAFNPEAVQRTFVLKGRPSNNPLIVHVATAEGLGAVARSWPDWVPSLVQRYWPGPLTLVLPKREEIPSQVTAGLDTVAVRSPRHPVARALIEATGSPLSAPSANRFMHVSPTRAEDIEREIIAGIALCLDGGPCDVGIESTVLDCSGDLPLILRPGDIGSEELSDFLGRPVARGGGDIRAPGMYPRHYAPSARVVLVDRLLPDQPGLALGGVSSADRISMPNDPSAYARDLYHAFHELDALELETIYVEKPPNTSEWLAVWDRLRRSTAE